MIKRQAPDWKAACDKKRNALDGWRDKWNAGWSGQVDTRK